MDLLKDYTDTDGQPVQSYFAAFMIEKGYTRARHIFERDGHGLEYLLWNAERWREFEQHTGEVVEPRHRRAKEFTAWLNDRAIDHACRNDIEGVAA